VGPVKPSYKIAAFFPTSQSFGPIADLAEEWVSKMQNFFCFFNEVKVSFGLRPRTQTIFK
jgi:hypothetical protein